MTVQIILAQEGQLLNVLERLGSLFWKRFQRRFLEIWVVDHAEIHDHSSYPPSISFRFKGEPNNIIDKLRSAVSEYEGELRWTLQSREREGLPGIIWSIIPEEVSQKENRLVMSFLI